MAIKKAIGVSAQGGAGSMMGQTVPMMRHGFATTQPGSSGFKGTGALVGDQRTLSGGGSPNPKSFNDAPFRRPQNAPAAKNVYGRWINDYSPKKRI